MVHRSVIGPLSQERLDLVKRRVASRQRATGRQRIIGIVVLKRIPPAELNGIVRKSNREKDDLAVDGMDVGREVLAIGIMVGRHIVGIFVEKPRKSFIGLTRRKIGERGCSAGRCRCCTTVRHDWQHTQGKHQSQCNNSIVHKTASFAPEHFMAELFRSCMPCCFVGILKNEMDVKIRNSNSYGRLCYIMNVFQP